MSAFDPDRFMQETVEGANDTTYPTIPAGEYTGMISDVKIRQIESKKNPGTYMYPCDVTWELLNVPNDILREIGREKITVRQNVWLDITDNGSLDLGKGKNVNLGRLREALDLNRPGFTLGQLNGAGPARLSVTLKPDNNDVMRNEVAAVGKVS